MTDPSPSQAWLDNLRASLATAIVASGTLRLVAYIRLSMLKLDPVDHLLGLQRQYEACVRQAEAVGGAIVAVYCDMSKSADTRKGARPDFQRMMADLPSFDGLIPAKFDRAFRDPEDVVPAIRMFEDHPHLKFWTANDRYQYALHTIDGRAKAYGAATRGLEELADNSWRQEQRYQQWREAGKVWGPRAFGWQDCSALDMKACRLTPAGWVPGMIRLHDEEAALLRDTAAQLLAGVPMSRIVKDWRDKGFTSTQGTGAVSHSTIRNMLLSPRMVGWVTHRKQGLPRSQWFYVAENGSPVRSMATPILDEATWFALGVELHRKQDTYRDKSGIREKVAASYPLTGLCICWKCLQPLYGMKPKKGVPYHTYRCHEGCTTIHGPRLEEELEGLLLARWSTAPVVEVPDVPFAQEARYQTVLRKRAELEQAYNADDMDLATMRRLDGPLKDEEATLSEARNAHLMAVATAQPRGTVADWHAAKEQGDVDTMRLMARRALLHVLIKQGVRGSKVWNPDRIVPEWR